MADCVTYPDITKCPACRSPSNRLWGADQDEPILECLGCGTTYFVRPIVQPHDYASYYPYLRCFDHARFKWELSQRRRRFLFQLREIGQLDPPGRRLVDFGAGPGYFCAIAGEAGWSASGVETSASATEAGVREFGIRYTALEEIPAGSVSVITAFHVLEHLEAPQQIIHIFREKLAPRGVLVVHVPNRESMSALLRHRLLKLFRGSRPRRGSMYYPEHVTGFTSAGLAMCANAAGFELIRSRQRSSFSRFHDPWLLRNYFVDGSVKLRPGSVSQIVKKFASGLIDSAGESVKRGDWLVAHFRLR